MLARTLASLESQTYPKPLFEVVVVDDGSRPPLEPPSGVSLDLRIVRQERPGPESAAEHLAGRARNAGVRAAAHEIVLFLDSDLLVEADWMTRHVRWHRAYAGVVTMGAPGYVAVDDLDAGAVRRRAGPLSGLFGARPADPPLYAAYLAETANLTSRAADPFSVLDGADFGIRKEFYRTIGGHDESFRRYGSEDREFAWRAEARGGLLVPLPGPRSWQQHRRADRSARRERDRRINRRRLAQRVPHPRYRESQPGRSWAVPRTVAAVEAADTPVPSVVRAVANLLAGPDRDLVVRLEGVPSEGADRERLENEFAADPRVFLAPGQTALEQFPTAPFHLRLPAAAFRRGLARRLRRALGDAAHAEAALPEGGVVRITRGWALHRAERTGRPPADFGETKAIPLRALRRERASASGADGGPRPPLSEAVVRRAAAAVLRRSSAGPAPTRTRARSASASAASGDASRLEPVRVPGNDWRRIEPPLEGFAPTAPVSVVVPCHRTPAPVLERTLASLERQTYPRPLFEVLLVDDGSHPPLEPPADLPFPLRLLRRETRGGSGAARNTGARAAAHDILLFLDADMLVESDWLASHALWHHAFPEVVTLGFRRHVGVDDLDAASVRRRPGSLRALLAGRPTDPPRAAAYLAETNDLTRPGADDLFRAFVSADFGLRREFYESLGGFDETFRRWGLEDKEFAWRAFAAGGLLAPLLGQRAWHQGRWDEGRAAKVGNRRINAPLAAHRIPHRRTRPREPGRTYLVPRSVVTVAVGGAPIDGVIRCVVNLLADRDTDLVVRLELASPDGERRERLENEFGADPRVLVAPTRTALEQFPAAAFHLRLPPAVFRRHLAHRLRRALGGAVHAEGESPDQSPVSITRGWALHRAGRTGGAPADFGEVRRLPPRFLKRERPHRAAEPAAPAVEAITYPTARDRWIGRARNLRSPADAWWFLRRALAVGRRRLLRRIRRRSVGSRLPAG